MCLNIKDILVFPNKIYFKNRVLELAWPNPSSGQMEKLGPGASLLFTVGYKSPDS